MAKIRPGGGIAQASGSLGGLVFSHNRGGAYVRARSIPVQPRSARQLEVRSNLSNASISWDLLDAAAQEQWRSWAESNPIMNTLGDAVRLAGNAAYVQLNSRLLFGGFAQIAAPPVITAPRPLQSFSYTADGGAGTTLITFAETPLTTNDCLYLRACYLPRPGINFVKNLLRFIGVSPIAQVTGYDYQAQLEAVLGPMPTGAGLCMWAYVLDSTTGLLSPPMRDTVTIVHT